MNAQASTYVAIQTLLIECSCTAAFLRRTFSDPSPAPCPSRRHSSPPCATRRAPCFAASPAPSPVVKSALQSIIRAGHGGPRAYCFLTSLFFLYCALLLSAAAPLPVCGERDIFPAVGKGVRAKFCAPRDAAHFPLRSLWHAFESALSIGALSDM